VILYYKKKYPPGPILKEKKKTKSRSARTSADILTASPYKRKLEEFLKERVSEWQTQKRK
jgi:hypothetical protein